MLFLASGAVVLAQTGHFKILADVIAPKAALDNGSLQVYIKDKDTLKPASGSLSVELWQDNTYITRSAAIASETSTIAYFGGLSIGTTYYVKLESPTQMPVCIGQSVVIADGLPTKTELISPCQTESKTPEPNKTQTATPAPTSTGSIIPSTKFVLTGTVYGGDGETTLLAGATVDLWNIPANKSVSSVQTKPDGTFELPVDLPSGKTVVFPKDYFLQFTATNYTSFAINPLSQKFPSNNFDGGKSYDIGKVHLYKIQSATPTPTATATIVKSNPDVTPTAAVVVKKFDVVGYIGSETPEFYLDGINLQLVMKRGTTTHNYKTVTTAEAIDSRTGEQKVNSCLPMRHTLLFLNLI
ncbi:MAG: hypothetical protein NTZ65_03925 [Candidatus Berkelbacteria bacterium]|nr:hypothetical protein [Candidatus Berkelbacteria bacterium]